MQTGDNAQDHSDHQAQPREHYELNGISSNERIRSEEQEESNFESTGTHGLSTTEPSVTFEPTINQSANLNELDCNNSDFVADMMHHEEAKLQKQRENEINAAIRCLATNLVLCSAFIICSLLASAMNQMQIVVVMTLLKTVVPIVATISNFVKIHTLLIETCINCKDKVSDKLNEMRVFG
jgi:hypothetical protein